MKSISTFVVGLAVSVVAFGFISPAITSAQQKTTGEPGADDQTLQRLLAEVRELRLTVERAMVDGTRVQVLVERARLQQGRVDTMTRQLDEIHSQVTSMSRQNPHFQQQIKDAEEQLDHTSDSSARAQMDASIKEAKATLARMEQEEEDLRNRETALQSTLQAEQLKLNELNNQLDALIKELSRP